MARRSPALPFETAASLLERLGGISPRRVRLQPPPGQATEADLVRLNDRTNKLYELVDGTLVEKVMGWTESSLALRIGRFLGNFADEHDLGDLAGADGVIRLMPGLVRIPDVAFVSWKQLPGKRLPAEAVPGLVPDLAVELLSEGNTPAEMEIKLKEYFLAGVPLVWLVDPRKRTVEVFTAPDQSTVFTEGQTLDGGAALPGLRLPVRQIFARVPTQRPRKQPKRNRPA